MPGKRAIGQTVVALALDESLLGEVDAARAKEGRDRSTFIRIALIEYLHAKGFPVDPTLAFPPDRASRKLQRSESEDLGGKLPNDSGNKEQRLPVAPLAEIGPPKSKIAITAEAEMAALEAQLPSGLLDRLVEAAKIEMTHVLLQRAAGTAGSGTTEPAPAEAPVVPPSKSRRRGAASTRGTSKGKSSPKAT